MKYQNLIATIKESVKEAAAPKPTLPPGYPQVPLINYIPPGVPVIINPIVDTANVPQGPKPGN
jgi:hypothetical protein